MLFIKPETFLSRTFVLRLAQYVFFLGGVIYRRHS